ncbi:MAG: TetR/AcrR family transcriptional regulator [Lachnospiraceae bacterium]|nr:TetR/AcrR family transcriptional regulator [Lachnospiraceae bacterium]
MSDGYHHGNLRQALIDAGIKIINERGEDGLSLRKVAAACGVSHAAPYAHFKDKEELMEAIKASVNEQFMDELEQAVAEAKNAEGAIINMGRSYVSFFVRNPDYFRFLFGNQNIIAHPRPDKHFKEDYPPFTLLKDTYQKYLKEKKIKKKKEEQELDVIRLWSSAHGLAAIACMPGVETSFDWEEKKIWAVLLR